MNIEKIRSEAPEGATHYIDGLRYLNYYIVIGQHVYKIWRGGEWSNCVCDWDKELRQGFIKPLF